MLCSSDYTNEIIHVLFAELSKAGCDLSATIINFLVVLADRALTSNIVWYAEVMIRLLCIKGDLVPDYDLQQFIKTVIATEDIQVMAAKLLIQFASDTTTPTNNGLTLACAMILRHCGELIANDLEGG